MALGLQPPLGSGFVILPCTVNSDAFKLMSSSFPRQGEWFKSTKFQLWELEGLTHPDFSSRAKNHLFHLCSHRPESVFTKGFIIYPLNWIKPCKFKRTKQRETFKSRSYSLHLGFTSWFLNYSIWSFGSCQIEDMRVDYFKSSSNIL